MTIEHKSRSNESLHATTRIIIAAVAAFGVTTAPVAARNVKPQRAASPALQQPAPTAPNAVVPPVVKTGPGELAPPTADLSRPWPEPLWLSEAPPGGRGRKGAAPADHSSHDGTASATPAGLSVGMAEMRNAEAAAEGMVEMNSHSGAKRVWLRRGDDPATASAVKPNVGERLTLQILAHDGRRWEAPLVDDGKGASNAKVDLPALGFYNAYLLRRSVQGGLLDVQVAKAELLKASCCSKRDFHLYKPVMDDSAPIEIVREHQPDEKTMTRLSSGDKAAFLVRSFGKPVAGAKVTVQTQEGWRKRAVTGADGRVEFALVRDYFPEWSDFNRRKTGTFLVLAELETGEAGILDGEPYAATRYLTSIAGRYYPAPYDYQSYAYGLTLILVVMTLSGLLVWIYRRRRVKPFKEIRFDEQIA